jgi:hypothetical protein
MKPDDDQFTAKRRRRSRIALLAGATATAAIVGTATALAVVSAAPGSGEADPGVGRSTTATGSAAASATDASPTGGAAVIPAGWEARSFQGVTFAVPPGGQGGEDIDQRHGPTFRWNGPDLGNGLVQASTSVTLVVRRRDGELPPPDGDQVVTVRGASAVHNDVGPADITSTDPDETFEVTAGVVQMFTADAVVFLGVQFPAGPVGEQMTHDLLASIDLTGLDASAATPS